MATRKQRGLTQNLYLINFDEQKGVSKKNFSVLGSTGNVYTVTIQDIPTCTCPDYTMRHQRCKHIYFILLKVMLINVATVDKLVYSNAELSNMFDNMQKIAATLYIPEDKQKEYNILGAMNAAQNLLVPIKNEDDVCPICLDDIKNGEPYDYCKYACGNPVHNQCFAMWTKNQKNSTCILCRSKWIA